MTSGGARTRGAVYGITAAAIWGGMYVVSDVVLETIPPFTLLTLRLLIGGAVLGFFLWRAGLLVWPPLPQLRTMLAVGLVGFGVSLGAQFVGTDLSTAVNGALITSASPAFILIFAALLLRERLTPRRIVAVLLATVGVVVIIDPASADFGSDTFAGDVALALAALTWGLYSVLVRRVSFGLDTLVLTFWAFVGGLLGIIPPAVMELASQPIGEIDLLTVAGVLYLGVISTAAAMWLWNRAFALVDASLASLFFFAQPLVGAVLGVTLLGQAFTLNIALGGLLIGIGVLVALITPPASSQRSESAVTG